MKISDCEGCQKRKEALVNMLTDHKFWIGVVVGVVGVYGYKKWVAKGS